MKLRNLGGTLVLMILVAQSIFSLELDLNRSQLPYKATFELDLAGPNQTANASYGSYVSGPELIFLNESNVYEYNIPIVPQGQYQSFVAAGGIIEEIAVNVTNDIIFNFSLGSDEIYLGNILPLNVQAPKGSSVGIAVEGPDTYSYNVTESTTLNIFPSKPGQYTVEISFRWANDTMLMQGNFLVLSSPTCVLPEISGEQNETISFSATVSGGMSPYIYTWKFGDGQKSTKASPVHAYDDEGDYDVSLDIVDANGLETSCSSEAVITGMTYDITFQLYDDAFGEALGDANITFNDDLKKSNVNGKALFEDIASGSYTIEIIKKGYSDVEDRIDVRKSETLVFNLSELTEEEKPVPKITLLYPDNEAEVGGDASFDFIVKSNSDIYECLLLVNYADNRGYKVKDTLEEPGNGEYTLTANLTDGYYKWRIQCENEDGIGKSIDQYITVTGSAPEVIEEPEEAAAAEPVVKAAPIDVTMYNEALSKVESLKKEMLQASPGARDAFSVLGFEGQLDSAISRITSLRKDALSLVSLEISESDRTRKINEYLSELAGIKAKTPFEFEVLDQYDYIQDDGDIDTASEEYIAWQKLNLSERQVEKYKSLVEDRQQDASIKTSLLTASATMLDGREANYGLVSRVVDYDIPGGVYLEVIPKELATDISQATFSRPYELVNKDPVVRIYVESEPEYTYYISKKLSIEQLQAASGVVVLDTDYPENKITGFAILDASQMSGKMFFALILLSIVLTANYFIFFRDPLSREQFSTNVKGMYRTVRPLPKKERLLGLLDSVMDMLGSGDARAFAHFEEILQLYSDVDASLRVELKPIMSHLLTELDAHTLSGDIDRCYSRVMNGDWQNVFHEYQSISHAYKMLPEQVGRKIQQKYNKLSLAIQVHELKANVSPRELSVDDELYG